MASVPAAFAHRSLLLIQSHLEALSAASMVDPMAFLCERPAKPLPHTEPSSLCSGTGPSAWTASTHLSLPHSPPSYQLSKDHLLYKADDGTMSGLNEIVKCGTTWATFPRQLCRFQFQAGCWFGLCWGCSAALTKVMFRWLWTRLLLATALEMVSVIVFSTWSWHQQ